jgi:dTDP-4-dehydrorhamnose 3,5-epimerase
MPMPIDLTPEASAQLSFQRYDPAPAIDGVRLTPLKLHAALQGGFMELARLDAGVVAGADFHARQISLATAAPGRINAFHLHPREEQNELWTVIAGRLRVWLVDVRAGSPTVNARREVLLTGSNPQRLFIPWGVAHGYQAGPEGATLLYMADAQFNLEAPNEGRLPWDAFGAELWAEDRG